MLHPAVAAALEDVGEADDVAVDVCVRVLDGVAHPGLGGQVHDTVKALLSKQPGHAFAVGNVQFDEAETWLALQTRETVMLELRRVVVVEVVKTDHLVASRQQQLADMHADEAGSAGDEYSQSNPLIHEEHVCELVRSRRRLPRSAARCIWETLAVFWTSTC